MTAQNSGQPIAQLSVEELARLLRSAETAQFIDVREPDELALASLEKFENLPLSQYAEWSDTIHARLDPAQTVVVLCHHGVRSAQMCQWLLHQGYTQVKNVAGGIDAYSIRVDSSVPQY